MNTNNPAVTQNVQSHSEQIETGKEVDEKRPAWRGHKMRLHPRSSRGGGVTVKIYLKVCL